jgi:hypothetical protein
MKNRTVVAKLFLLAVAMTAISGLFASGKGVSEKGKVPGAADSRENRPLKVLMIGNSFSICVLRFMPAVAADLGLKLDICSLYIGGCSLERHMINVRAADTNPYKVTWNYVDAPKNNPPFKSALVWNEKKKEWQSNILTMLAADRWDIVTVQQASHFSWVPGSYEPFGTDLIAEIRRLAPQSEIYVQETWSYTPWDSRLKKWGIDQKEMDAHIESSYAAFAKRHGIRRIRMGSAVKRYRYELPVRYGEKSNKDDVCGVDKFALKNGKWRPAGDVFHLNARGEYLQALVWTAQLFDVDVTKSSYNAPAMAGRTAAADLMRRIASEVRE